MSEVLHAAWLPALRQLFVWGEQADAPPPKGRRAKLPAHPFLCSPDQLRELLASAAQLAEHTATIWLPTAAGRPLPSPELLAMGAPEPPQGQPELAAWRVAGLLAPIDPALDMLLAAPAASYGADMLAWRAATLLASEILAGQQVLPALEREGFGLRAAWQIRPAPATAAKLAALARAMPPLCRAAVAEPGDAPPARALLDDFLAAAVDATIRSLEEPRTKNQEPPQRRGRPIAGSRFSVLGSPAEKWLAALTGPSPQLDMRGAEADALFKAWQAWAGQGQAAGDDAFRITFRLEPPVRADQPWALDFLLRATDDPSLLVPAGQIWRERGASFSYLDRRFDHPQERLLAGLGYAARLFPPLEASLHQRAPERAQIGSGDAFTFLKDAAPLLEGSGFGVLIPSWWQGRGARLQARARAKPKGATPNAKSLLGFDTLVNFSWELTLAGEPIDRAEFERLAQLKQPLVQVRGQWVVLDPDQIERALKFLERGPGELTLAEALQLGLGGADQPAPAGVELGEMQAEGWLRGLLDELNNPERIALLPPPEGLQGQLRHYQQRGFAWVAFLRRFGLGACLADDMGLGKSIQTIAFLLEERERLAVRAPALIVCPTSVVGNWLRELGRFAPRLQVMLHRGGDRRTGASFARAAQRHDVVITSFPLLARDRATLTEVEWSAVVLDEAQNIKNAASQQAQAARALKAGARVALTGTPVENRLTELWSILSF